MPITNYPQGFANGLTVRGLPLLQTQPGNVFWVDNGPTISGGPSSTGLRTTLGSDNNHGTFQRPFATIAYALSQCLQGNGDIIFVKPGHTETVNGAGTTTAVTDPTGQITISAQTTVSLNSGSTAIIGLGAGAMRPTITFNTATAANIPLRASGMTIQNVLFRCNFAAVVSAITAVTFSVTASIANSTMTVTVVGSGTIYPGMTLLGTGILPGTMVLSQLTGTTGGIGTYLVSVQQTFASGTITGQTADFALESCEWRDLSSSLNLITVFTGNTTANSCDGLTVTNNRISSLGTTAATTAFKILSATDRVSMRDNYGNWAILNNTAAMLAAGANSITNFDFSRNQINRPNTATTSGLAISTSGTAWTGQCNDNRIWGLNGTAQIWINTGTKLAFNQNYCPITGAADANGLINPAAV